MGCGNVGKIQDPTAVAPSNGAPNLGNQQDNMSVAESKKSLPGVLPLLGYPGADDRMNDNVDETKEVWVDGFARERTPDPKPLQMEPNLDEYSIHQDSLRQKSPMQEPSKGPTPNPTNALIDSVPDQPGHCPHCEHCRRHQLQFGLSGVKPKWFINDPGSNGSCIHLDKYDDESARMKLAEEYGHYPGAYDYQPFLTIEELPEPENAMKSYGKEHFVAKMTPKVSPTHTPFPGYQELERREQRVVKPFSSTFYID